MNTIILIVVVAISLVLGYFAHKHFSKKSAKKMVDDIKATAEAEAQEPLRNLKTQLGQETAKAQRAVEEKNALEESLQEQKRLHLDDTIRYNPKKMTSLQDLVPLYKNYKEIQSESSATMIAFKNAARAGLTRIYKSIRLQDESVNVFEVLSSIMEKGYQLAKEKKEEMPILLEIFRDTNEEEQALILQIFKAEAKRLHVEGDGNEINLFLEKIRGRWAIDTNPYPALMAEILMLHERLKAMPVGKQKIA